MASLKKFNGNTWLDSKLRKLVTASDTITTLPTVLYPNDTTATVGLKGQTVQSSVPSPTSPSQPQGTGERTANLFDKSQPTTLTNKYLLSNGEESSNSSGWAASAYIPVSGHYVTLTGVGGILPSICAYDSSKQFVRGKNYENRNKTTIDISDCSFVRFSYVPTVQGDNAMLNTGNIALYYEPYGYKIPISSASTTTPVYLGEVETTRKIKKFVLTGEESVSVTATGIAVIALGVPPVVGVECVCSHYIGTNVTTYSALGVGECTTSIVASGGNRFAINDVSLSTADEYKAYFAQQYANGTPVTVWYVLAEPETGIVNEPLMKIGDYADSISGITIPTITGKDTFDVETTLKPSEVSLSYTGWHDATVKEWDGSQWQ